MPNDTKAPEPTSHRKTISAEDIEPPTHIRDPRAKRKMKRRFQSDSNYTKPSSPPEGDEEEDDDYEEEERGRSRSISGRRGTFASDDSDTGSRRNVPDAAFNGQQNFIFLGDFVDRGYFSLETFTLLMCLKAKYVTYLGRAVAACC